MSSDADEAGAADGRGPALMLDWQRGPSNDIGLAAGGPAMGLDWPSIISYYHTVIVHTGTK